MQTWQNYSQQKIISPSEIAVYADRCRQKELTIATVNGAFDLLHAGHMHMLFEASQTADILIVAVNSDASIRLYKDPCRPIISLSHRMEMLTALAFVDCVTWFDEIDPRAILHCIRPNVHVNGEEYGASCVEAEVVKQHQGRLHLVKRIPGLATSEVIMKIQHLGLKCD